MILKKGFNTKTHAITRFHFAPSAVIKLYSSSRFMQRLVVFVQFKYTSMITMIGQKSKEE